jgi:hypothetical protein
MNNKSALPLFIRFSKTSTYLAADFARSVLIAGLFMLGYFLLHIDPATVSAEVVLRHIQTKPFHMNSLYAGLALLVVNNMLLFCTSSAQANKQTGGKSPRDESKG